MDNIETTGPVGSDGATFSQDNSAIDTQPTETTDSVSDVDVAEVEQAPTPWDNDPKFKGKSPEDVYKAYQEAQKAIGQVSQKAEIANLIEQKYGMTPEQFKAQIEAQEYQQKQQLYANNPLAPIVDEVQALKFQLAQQEAKAALQEEKAELDKFLKDNPDYEPFKDKILNLGLNLEKDKSYEEIATEYFGNARAQGQQDAYKKIDTKRNTQATGAKSAPQKRFSDEDIENMSAAEYEALIPHADLSNRLY